MQRVVVTGLGAVTPLGLGVQRSWKRLIDGHCGVVSLKGRGKIFEQQQCRVAGLIPQGKGEDGAWTASEWLSSDEQRRMSTFMIYAIAASQEALEDSGWKPRTDQEQEITGICLGSGIGSLEEQYNTSLALDKGGSKKVSPLFVPKLLINLAAGHISMKYGFKGPTHAVTTACTTGAHSIGDASRFIAFGDAAVMLAGGAESCIHPLAFIGFERSRSLTTSFNHIPEQASRPFDAARDGFVIGEGAAVLVLESLPHALNRGARIYAEVAGYGTSSDAHHMTAPPPDGNGAFRSMRLALKNAAIPPERVDYINAHATSTPLGDLAENRAIKRLMLGENGKAKASEVNVSSTKGAVGHLLGAAGAAEALFSMLAIRDGILPPTLNLTEPDGPELDCNYVALKAQERRVDVVLSNSFGFGGTNASLCFKRWEGR
ncbi:hypothetical protein N7G274_006842 [Stereocaulon virgatum]|uniref:3-oxoacyl-[acyl-carrier-protein] synthase n=1 Tax=Stereocaulon virgatum TaxID=373712 RepID=A0ABR4A6L3_9LECA